MTQFPFFYENTIVWTGEKKGEVSGLKLPSLQVATPPDFGGHEGFWSPEQCFVAAVNACVMSTFLAIAQLSKLPFESYEAEASGKLDKPEGQVMQFTEITIRAKLVVTHSKDLERAGRLLEKAEKQCLVSNSIKAAVHLEPQVTAAGD
ncbi:MAG: OsmC family peroxiredoxin [Acidobacteria bacterium]|nr:MAG: OsmC family peroxiredoxin [Acidobacteriota bacterium]